MRSQVKKMAALGGLPTFAEQLHVGRPNIGDRERLFERIGRIIDTRWLSNGGPFVKEFEERVAGTVAVRHCIAMCNATVALEIAIRALELKGEVIVPSFTFVATAHALQWQGITPVFCDVDPATHNIDPRKVEALITSRTTGILGVHLWGRPCAIDELQTIADSHRLTLLFDAAHALGCESRGHPIGRFGNAEILSFHATKIVNAGEGGAVVTDDDDLAERVRLMKSFGFTAFDQVSCIGTNGKMSELSAAMGLTNLESLDQFVQINRRNFDTYKANLEGLAGLSLLSYEEANRPNYQYVVLEIDSEEFGLPRDHLLAVLHAENILARRYFYPGVHRMEPYRSRLPDAGLLLPNTEALAGRVLVLPTGTAITPTDIEKACAIIRAAPDHRHEISEALARVAR
jgi:dTDP-4-amino-4,6-dideoxygalactose transaminase